jgi:hypothetical protein
MRARIRHTVMGNNYSLLTSKWQLFVHINAAVKTALLMLIFFAFHYMTSGGRVGIDRHSLPEGFSKHVLFQLATDIMHRLSF